MRLKISPKSKVAFSRPGVARAVAEELAAGGIHVTATDFTKDLGLGTVVREPRRSAHVAAERRATMRRRLRRIKALVRRGRRCRSLIFTGANFLIASGPTLLVLQICGFFPKAEGIVILPEALFVLGSTAVGVAFFVLGFIASILQDDDQEGIKIFR